MPQLLLPSITHQQQGQEDELGCLAWREYDGVQAPPEQLRASLQSVWQGSANPSMAWAGITRLLMGCNARQMAAAEHASLSAGKSLFYVY